MNVGKDYVNHQKGNGKVAREMKGKFGGAFCVGIIDEDRKKLDYLNGFDMVAESKHLKLWKIKGGHQYMIQIRPVIEEWILANCKESGIDLKDYNLPNLLYDLIKITKSLTSKRDQRFIRLFKDMIKKGSGPMLELQKWLNYLNDKKFNTDINQLING